MEVPDHYVIQNMERTGYPDGKEPEGPRCPLCGSECETIYRACSHEIVGCDVCLTMDDAWETPECFPGKEL